MASQPTPIPEDIIRGIVQQVLQSPAFRTGLQQQGFNAVIPSNESTSSEMSSATSRFAAAQQEIRSLSPSIGPRRSAPSNGTIAGRITSKKK